MILNVGEMPSVSFNARRHLALNECVNMKQLLTQNHTLTEFLECSSHREKVAEKQWLINLSH